MPAAAASRTVELITFPLECEDPLPGTELGEVDSELLREA